VLVESVDLLCEKNIAEISKPNASGTHSVRIITLFFKIRAVYQFLSLCHISIFCSTHSVRIITLFFKIRDVYRFLSL
jgi:hypothetical protein